MSFYGNPCPCGWSLDELSETKRKCERCGRVSVKRSWGWMTHRPSKNVETLRNAKERREYEYMRRASEEE